MKSQLPKVLHSLSGRSLLERVLDCAASVQPDRRLVIVGFGADQVIQSIAHLTDVELVQQREQLGTGHAVQQLMPPLQGYDDDLIVLNGDVPLLRPETLQALLETHRTNGNAATILTAQLDDPKGYGRVFCDSANRVTQMVEDKDCTPEQKQNRRVNAGIYCFSWAKLAQVLPTLQNNNKQQEYYLTDAVTALAPVMAVDVEDYQEILGINDRQQLADADRILQTRIKQGWMKAGVTLVDPDSIRIEDEVQLEPDVIIEPQTHLRGKTLIRSGSRIGPGSLIENSEVGEKTIVLFSVVSDSVVQANSRIGPYAHLRGHVEVGQGCRIGNFVELKNARLGDRTNVAHLSYIGDATLGNRVNIGAGTITANYDGVQKHRTEIGDRSKTGSNSVLVAPLKLGADVTVAAGSVVTDSVPDDCLVVARARQVVKPGWRLNRSNGVSEPLPKSDLSPEARNSATST